MMSENSNPLLSASASALIDARDFSSELDTYQKPWHYMLGCINKQELSQVRDLFTF